MAEIEYVIESFEGKKTTGRLVWAAKELDSPAISGPHEKGSLPKGVYKAERNKLVDQSGPNNAYCDGKDKCWFQAMNAPSTTDRNGFGIHPDGNVVGTEGCIGLTESDTKPWYDALYALSRNTEISVEVK